MDGAGGGHAGCGSGRLAPLAETCLVTGWR